MARTIMIKPQLRELLLQALEHERGGALVYFNALECTRNERGEISNVDSVVEGGVEMERAHGLLGAQLARHARQPVAVGARA